MIIFINRDRKTIIEALADNEMILKYPAKGGHHNIFILNVMKLHAYV